MALASSEATQEASHGSQAFLLWLPVILIAAAISKLIEKIGQPSVLGELIMGVLIGNLALIGINWLEPIKTDFFIQGLAEFGVVVLLFQVGLESNIQKMMKVGLPAFLVAVIGVVLPFILGTYVVGPMMFPGLSQVAYLFLGASLVATSVGITARVFQDLNKSKIREAQVVLGAAVIDDVLGLIILAVVSAIATVGSVSVGAISIITGKAVLFLIGSIVIGVLAAPKIGQIFSKINNNTGMKAIIVLSFGLIFAYLAGQVGLAPIVGAFAAGLVLDPVHFKFFRDPQIIYDIKESVSDQEPVTKSKLLEKIKHHSDAHVEDLIKELGNYIIPVFFVLTGMAVNIETLFDLPVLMTALVVTFVAVITKIVAGLAAGKGSNKLIVGVGMIPRGEVGLIFATIGAGLGVVNDELFSVIVIMVILTTLLTPPILAYLLKKQDKNPSGQVVDQAV
ncbi:MAG: cation:proton antiporter [Candidatus Buchananbacteria bacterium]|nr:cation:proton antiporter [Candidatus Buchananbacteria bacterium]